MSYVDCCPVKTRPHSNTCSLSAGAFQPVGVEEM
jgi:hypothetical protein